MDGGLEVLRVVSLRGMGQPGWWIFKHLEEEPDAIGVVDGPYPTPEVAQLEAKMMMRRRTLIEHELR